jgi:membrane protein DedA with SNARE-associated domain
MSSFFTTITQTVFPVLSAHPYAFILVGMFFAGETVLIPALYLCAIGKLSLFYVFSVALFSTLISDFIWYLVGRYLPHEKITGLLNKHSAKTMDALSHVFTAHRLKTLFLSKFVYGTRTAAQVLSGTFRVPFFEYLAVNILGTGSIMGALAFFAYTLNRTSTALADFTHQLEVTFGIFVIIVITVQVLIKHVIARKWFQ